MNENFQFQNNTNLTEKGDCPCKNGEIKNGSLTDGIC
jgi:hypothetical protein